MRRRRPRGIGCLGCLPFGGLLFTLIPLIAIGVLVYWLVNRQKPSAPQVAPPPPGTPAGGVFCSGCGKPMGAAEKFCASCGTRAG